MVIFKKGYQIWIFLNFFHSWLLLFRTEKLSKVFNLSRVRVGTKIDSFVPTLTGFKIRETFCFPGVHWFDKLQRITVASELPRECIWGKPILYSTIKIHNWIHIKVLIWIWIYLNKTYIYFSLFCLIGFIFAFCFFPEFTCGCDGKTLLSCASEMRRSDWSKRSKVPTTPDSARLQTTLIISLTKRSTKKIYSKFVKSIF